MSKNSNETPNLFLSKIILGVAIFGVLLTIITELSHHFPIVMELCGGESSGCADVASTSFAKMFGVSVAYWGLLSYVVFISFFLYAPKFVYPLAAALLGAELYFLWVMSVVLETYCTFCLIQLATVIVLFILTLLWAIGRSDFFLPGKLWSAPLVILIAFSVLMAPVKYGRSGQTIGAGELVTYIGDPNSKVVMEIFSDYECGHCKNLEPEIDKLVKENPDVLIILRDFIIRGHQVSPVASSYANAIAFTKGREEFLETRREIFDNQERLYSYLEGKLPSVNFTEELKTKIQAKLDHDKKRASFHDIASTPSFAIYRNGKFIKLFRGYRPYEQFASLLKQ